jgi:hypothetical protein
MVVKFIIIILISYNRLNYNYLGEIMISNININNVAADWNPGDPAIVPPPANYEALINSVETSASTGLQCPFWYLCLQNTNTVENSDTAVQQNFCPRPQKHI